MALFFPVRFIVLVITSIEVFQTAHLISAFSDSASVSVSMSGTMQRQRQIMKSHLNFGRRTSTAIQTQIQLFSSHLSHHEMKSKHHHMNNNMFVRRQLHGQRPNMFLCGRKASFSHPKALYRASSCRTITIPTQTPPTIKSIGALGALKSNEIDIEIEIDKKSEVYNELVRLTSEIQQHDHLYYTPGLTPLLTDDEYDALTVREAELCKNNPELLKRLEDESELGSKVSRYGGRVGPIVKDDDDDDKNEGVNLSESVSKGKLHHLENSPMQSLDNAMLSPQVVKWLNRVRKLLFKSMEEGECENGTETNTKTVEIIAEPKMDGLSLSLRYTLHDIKTKQYKLAWGATRGDGTKGEDVTDAVNAIGMIPQDIVYDISINSNSNGNDLQLPEVIEVRGEVVLPTSKFAELNASCLEAESETTVDGDGDSSSESNSDIELEKVAAGLGPLLPNQFSNARNAASGILLRRKPKSDLEIENNRVLRSYLKFYAYSIEFSFDSNTNTNSEEIHADTDAYIHYNDGMEMRTLMKTIGFTVPTPCKLTTITLDKDEEVPESDCQTLFEYHHAVMTNRHGASEKSESTGGEYEFDFDVDGAVYKVSSVSDRSVLGSSSRFPRWAIAHKFPAQCAVTRLKDVEVQIGRTGSLTPVAVLDPVDLGGVTVTRASLHNFEFAQTILKAKEYTSGGNSNIGIPKGASLMISRAGDVIPQVMQRLEHDVNDQFEMSENDFISLQPPTTCPACGSKTVFQPVGGRERSKQQVAKTKDAINKDNVLDVVNDEDKNGKEIDNGMSSSAETVGQVLRCGGPQLLCRPRAVGALSHAFSRAGLDIKGLSDAKLQQLVNETLIRIPADLFQITDEDSQMFQNITELPGWGNKSASNLQSVSKMVVEEGVSLSSFIYSLGIRHIGVHSSSLIASAYISSSDFVSALHDASKTDFQNENSEQNVTSAAFPTLTGDGSETNEGVKGIGPVLIESLISFAKNEELLESAKKLAEIIPVHDAKSPIAERKSEIVSGRADTSLLPFDGKSVVFTGSLPEKLTRIMAQNLAIDLGAKSTPSSVSQSTGLVVVGQKGGKKAEKAKEMGIDTMTAEEFIALAKKKNR